MTNHDFEPLLITKIKNFYCQMTLLSIEISVRISTKDEICGISGYKLRMLIISFLLVSDMELDDVNSK